MGLSRSPRPGQTETPGQETAVTDESTAEATAAFVAHRNLLFTVAYEILGSATDAEDVLQETWLRWVGVDLADVRDRRDRKSTRLNSSHVAISYAVFCLKKKKRNDE